MLSEASFIFLVIVSMKEFLGNHLLYRMWGREQILFILKLTLFHVMFSNESSLRSQCWVVSQKQWRQQRQGFIENLLSPRLSAALRVQRNNGFSVFRGPELSKGRKKVYMWGQIPSYHRMWWVSAKGWGQSFVVHEGGNMWVLTYSKQTKLFTVVGREPFPIGQLQFRKC